MSELGQVFTMDEALKVLGVSRTFMAPILAEHPFYFSTGRVKRFTERDLVKLYAVLRDKGRAPIPEYEPHYVTAKAKQHKAAVAKAPEGYVYFIQSGEFVKIGFSVNWKKRLVPLRTGSPHPITVLHVMPAPRIEEERLHRRFAGLRHNLEWFRHEGALRTYIAQLTTGGGSVHE